MNLEFVPNLPLTLILQFIGKPEEYLHVLEVCRSWYNRFDPKDGDLWHSLSVDQSMYIHSPMLKRSLRCTTNHKKVFINTYYKLQNELNEKHDVLVIQSKSILEAQRDQPSRLDKLIRKYFPELKYFNPNWRCKTMEDNGLLTLACRYSQHKCIKLLVESPFKADVNVADVGGFTPLILCAYHGNFQCILQLLQLGADPRAVGRLRSGPRLTAEHWAAIQGKWEIFRFLRAMRVRPLGSLINSIEESQCTIKVANLATRNSTCRNDSSSGTGSSSSAGSHNNEDRTGVQDVEGVLEQGEDLLLFSDLSSDMLLASVPDPLATAADSVPNLDSSEAPEEAGAAGKAAIVPLCPAQFCLCGQGYDSAMVACDAPDCPLEWFHFSCVGLMCRVRDLSSLLRMLFLLFFHFVFTAVLLVY
jgi:hypothetical protein